MLTETQPYQPTSNATHPLHSNPVGLLRFDHRAIIEPQENLAKSQRFDAERTEHRHQSSDLLTAVTTFVFVTLALVGCVLVAAQCLVEITASLSRMSMFDFLQQMQHFH